MAEVHNTCCIPIQEVATMNKASGILISNLSAAVSVVEVNGL